MAEWYPIGTLLSEVQEKRSFEGLNPGPYHHLLSIDDFESVSSALRKLHAHKVLSAPVIFRNGKHGLVDIADIASAIANAPAMGLDYRELTTMTLKDLYSFMPLREAITLSSKLPVLELITALSTGNRRVIITNSDGDDKPLGLLSQMDVLRFLVRHWDQVPAQVRAEPADRIMTKKPHTVSANEPVVQVLHMLVRDSISGVGIVDDLGKLIANFSVTDLRSPSPEALPDLLKGSVADFLYRAQDHRGQVDLLRKELILADPSASLEEAAKMMLTHHVHRVYVLDRAGHPVGVLSTTDVCVFLAKTLGKQSKSN
jgi:CBS domain-containing protein